MIVQAIYSWLLPVRVGRVDVLDWATLANASWCADQKQLFENRVFMTNYGRFYELVSASRETKQTARL